MSEQTIDRGFTVELKVDQHPGLMDRIFGLTWLWTLQRDGKYVTSNISSSRAKAMKAAAKAARQECAGTRSKFGGGETVTLD